MSSGPKDKAEKDNAAAMDAAGFSRLVGKHILVGITRLDAFGKLLGQSQCHGVVMRADSGGIFLRLSGTREGEEFSLPPDLRGIEPAPPGEYSLRSSGETVVDPDYLATWTVTEPQKH